MAHGQGGAEIANDRAPTLTCNHEAPIAIYENHGTDSRIKEVEVCPTVTSRWGTGGNNVPLKMEAVGTDCYNGSITGDVACTMGTPGSSVNASGPTVMVDMAVRRLTPIECERLQGFPDNYTNIPWRNKPESPDSPRYKAMGNSMAVPVMRWIGERIQSAVLIAHNDNNPITLEKSA